MIKVMIFDNFRYPKDLAFKIARELNFELYYIDIDPKVDSWPIYITKLRWAEEEGIDVIICSFYDYHRLSKLESSIPVISSNFSNWETLSIINSLKKNVVEKHFPHPHKVAMVTVEPLAANLNELSAIFDLELHNVIRPRENINENYFKNLKAEGFEVVACAKHLKDMVLEAGMLHAYDDNITSYEGLKDELTRILQMVKISQQISQRNRELRQLINYAFEAVWMTDNTGMITTCNDAAAKLFDHNIEKSSPSFEEDYTGRSIYDVLPESIHPVIEDTLKNGTSYYSYLLLHTHSDGVFNINPITKDSVVECAIFHFTSLPQLEQMEEKIKIESYVKGHRARYTFHDIIGDSNAIRQTIDLANRFAKYESNVLILGESGTGKEVFAQSIHNASVRRMQPFVALNCGALPPNLLESELFGYVDGAFTGASRKGKKGLFEIADQGTIFLDEISEMDAQGQVRLLRVLEEREVMRIGSDKVIPVNVRIIAACNKNLERLVMEGKFRQDLFYRLNVLTLGIPPLRMRSDDISLLADNFLSHYGEKYQKIVRFNHASREVLAQFDWPGNVRQLKNFCERLVIVADDNKLSPEFIRDQLNKSRQFGFDSSLSQTQSVAASVSDPSLHKKEIIGTDSNLPLIKSERERNEIIAALNQTGGSRQQTAAMLGISTATLWRKIKKYNISGLY